MRTNMPTLAQHDNDRRRAQRYLAWEMAARDYWKWPNLSIYQVIDLIYDRLESDRADKMPTGI